MNTPVSQALAPDFYHYEPSPLAAAVTEDVARPLPAEGARLGIAVAPLQLQALERSLGLWDAL